MCRFDKWHLVILLLLVLVFSVHCFQPSYNLSKVAGGGSIIGDGLVSSQVLLSSPSGIIVSNSEIIFCDTNNHRIRKIDTNGVVSTIAGTGNAGYSG